MAGNAEMGITPTIFTDGLLEASVHHGVARLVLGQIRPDGKPAPAMTLCVPLAQLPALAGALGEVVKQVEQRLRENGTRQGGANGDTVPGAFTFGGA